jgi:hypothetical protein
MARLWVQGAVVELMLYLDDGTLWTAATVWMELKKTSH